MPAATRRDDVGKKTGRLSPHHELVLAEYRSSTTTTAAPVAAAAAVAVDMAPLERHCLGLLSGGEEVTSSS
ncbi:hypothetical protein Taro_007062 [Colocasia esculenta]|uniref:Uncharacterized protein n=1 Tax=Colocasia esculenta TaxID=4460 RepID=A0A843TUF8_COLES|nr:hypothetical protein [Colocasia esculenta]